MQGLHLCVQRLPFCIPATAVVMVGALAVLIAACSGVQDVPNDDHGDKSYLEFDVEPTTAEIYVDGDYRGSVDGWNQQVMPIEPGARRLELRADGFISQRFDLEVKPDRWLTLRVRLEPTIEPPGEQQDPDDDGDDDGLSTPPHPTAP